MKAGRIVLVVMVLIVFADFLVRFGLMLRDEYRGKGVSKRMAFGPANPSIDPASTDQTVSENTQSASQDSPGSVEFNPIKLIAPVVEVRRNKRRRSKRKHSTKSNANVGLAMLALLAFAQLATVNAAPIRQGNIPDHGQQKQTPLVYVAVILAVAMAALIIRAYMVAKLALMPHRRIVRVSCPRNQVRFGNLPSGEMKQNELTDYNAEEESANNEQNQDVSPEEMQVYGSLSGKHGREFGEVFQD